MKSEQLQDKFNIQLLLGCYCNNPKLVLDEKYKTEPQDYVDSFHRKIWGAIYNICRKTNIDKITGVEIQNELSTFDDSLKEWNSRGGFEWIEEAIYETKDRVYNAESYRDSVRKYTILRSAIDTLGMDISFVYPTIDDLEPNLKVRVDREKLMEKFLNMNSKELLNTITSKLLDFKNAWDDGMEDNYSFTLGDGVDELVDSLKQGDNAWGYPYQSAYLTTVFRGMRSKKFLIRSSISGGGKSRACMADACNIGCDRLYDWSKGEWVSIGEACPVLYISTELTREEIQTCILAHICGIEEDRLTEWRDITEVEERIIYEAKEIMKSAKVYGEYMPDFTIDSIADSIELYIINKGITHCFFDYINDSPSIYAYYQQKTGIKLQTHQILFLFSASLKQVANKYDIFMGSATQLSSNWKEEKDANALKGSKAIIEKADGGMLALPCTPEDLKKLDPILKNGFYEKPNYCYHIFKNRGGKWKSIIVWTKLNMGTMRENDCFVTKDNYELITDIEKTMLELSTIDVGEATQFEDNDDIAPKEFISELNKTKI